MVNHTQSLKKKTEGKFPTSIQGQWDKLPSGVLIYIWKLLIFYLQASCINTHTSLSQVWVCTQEIRGKGKGKTTSSEGRSAKGL